MNELDLFEQALDIPEGERIAWLERACAGNASLHAKLLELLAADLSPSTLLSEKLFNPLMLLAGADSTLGNSSPTLPSLPLYAGIILAGRFELLELIGEGGMGSVWLARQSSPVKRTVAIKLIKPGMNSREVVARFEAERQALAVMDHPNIAKVFEGGLTDQGQPYFVMELVKGVSITCFCDEHKLSLKERLKLFIPVCQAIQHAHQKGIIHRDIKPSNLLVSIGDKNEPVPKIIDFGIAKATAERLIDETNLTGFGGLVGTPEYMSPEQASFTTVDIDTRSDIYSLGVVLYELLTGVTPLDKQRIKQVPLLEVMRQIATEEPKRPSSRLEKLPTNTVVAANRGLGSQELVKLLRQDLDWVTLRALEKDRSRRYETASELAADIERHLAGEAVLAHPPSRSYRLRKLLKRHRGPVLATLLLLLTLMGGVIGTSLGWSEARNKTLIADSLRIEAQRSEQTAIKAAAAEKEAREQTQKRLEQMRQSNAILSETFEYINPGQVDQNGARLKSIAAELRAEALGEPLVVADLQSSLGESLRAYGHFQEAIQLHEEARQTRTRLLGPDHRDTLVSGNLLGRALLSAGQLEQAVRLFGDTHERMVHLLGPEFFETVNTLANLADAEHEFGLFESSLRHSREAHELRKRLLGEDNRLTLVSLNRLAVAYQASGQLRKSLPLYREAYDLTRRKLAPDHPDSLTAMNNLGSALRESGRLTESVKLLEESFQLCTRRFGKDHPDSLVNANSLARTYRASGELEKAVPLFVETVRLAKARLGPEHPLTLTCVNNLGLAYQSTRQWDRALSLFEETLIIRRKTIGRDHPNTLHSMNNTALCLQALHRFDKALPLFEETLKLREGKLSAGHPETLASLRNLAHAYYVDAQQAKALPLYEQVIQKLKARQENENPKVVATARSLAIAYLHINRVQDALKEIDTFLASRRTNAMSPTTQAELTRLLADFGETVLESKQFEAAESYLREALSLSDQSNAPRDWKTFQNRSLLAASLMGMNKHSLAEQELLQSIEGFRKGENTLNYLGRLAYLDAQDRLIEVYRKHNKPENLKNTEIERQKNLDTINALTKEKP